MSVCIETLKKISLDDNEYLLIEYSRDMKKEELPILVHALQNVFGENFKKILYAPKDRLKLSKISIGHEKRTDH